MQLTPENESEQTRLLKEYFRQWNLVLETRGEPYGDPVITTTYEFAVDRRMEEESLLTADEVEVNKLGDPLEEYTSTEPEAVRTHEGEEWIEIIVTPKNPYHPALGLYTERGRNFYYTERLNVFLSSQGRAYQTVDWSGTLEPDIHAVQNPIYSYLKNYPSPQEIQTRFTKEPEAINTEPFQPLRGESLERMDFLMFKLTRGEILDNS